MANAVDGLVYGAAQAARVAWFAGHYMAGRRLLKPMPKPDFAVGPSPDRAELVRSMLDLFRRDWAHIAAGTYAAPPKGPGNLARLARLSLDYFRDLPQVDRRRHAGINDEVPTQLAADEKLAELPRYFRQNFHYQSGGYLSEHSARLYDLQVEVLFTGAADAMRRQALPPLAQHFHGRNTRAMSVLDIGCGTGRLLGFMRDTWPGLTLTGLDLSAPYLAHAAKRLGRSRRLKLIEGAGEAIPLPDASQDAITCVFLLHELPKKIRARMAQEMARVLKPGGRVVLVDSLQHGDKPQWDGLLDLFPYYFHEPYYAEYARSDIAALMAEAGFVSREPTLAYLAKVMTFDRA